MALFTQTFYLQLGIVFCFQLLAVFCKHLLDIRLRKKYTNWYVSLDDVVKMRNAWEEMLREKKLEVETIDVEPRKEAPPPPEVKTTFDPRYPEVPIVKERIRKFRPAPKKPINNPRKNIRDL